MHDTHAHSQRELSRGLWVRMNPDARNELRREYRFVRQLGLSRHIAQGVMRRTIDSTTWGMESTVDASV